MNLLQKFRPWEWVLIPLLATAYQAAVKILAAQLAAAPAGMPRLERVFRTPLTAAVVACEVVSFILWMRVLAVTDISRAVPLTALSYALVVLMGWTVFHEPVSPPEIAGSVLILSGVWILRTP